MAPSDNLNTNAHIILQAAIHREASADEEFDIIPVEMREANPEDLRRLLSIETSSFPRGDHTPNGSAYKAAFIDAADANHQRLPVASAISALQVHEDVNSEPAQAGVQGNNSAGG